MVLHPPSCLGITPKPEQRKLGKGGELKGPRIRLCMHSECRASSKMDGSIVDDCKFFYNGCKMGTGVPDVTTLSYV